MRLPSGQPSWQKGCRSPCSAPPAGRRPRPGTARRPPSSAQAHRHRPAGRELSVELQESGGVTQGGLHDRLVHRAALGDGLLGGLQHPAVVLGHDRHELLRLDGPVGQQPGRHLRSGLLVVQVDAVPQPDPVFVAERLEVHHLVVVDPGQVSVRVVDEGHPAGHARAEVATGGAEDHHPATGHVLTGVVPHSFDDGDGAGVADTEALPHLSPQEHLAAGGPVEDDVAGDDVLLGGERCVLGRAHMMRPPERPLPR